MSIVVVVVVQSRLMLVQPNLNPADWGDIKLSMLVMVHFELGVCYLCSAYDSLT